MDLLRFGQAMVICALVSWVGTAHAGTNGFLVPPFRGAPDTESGYWETFTVPHNTPGNLPDQAGATTGAVFTQMNTNAFLTGSGNIYNLNGVSSFMLMDKTPFTLGTVVLQTRTVGSELDYDSVSLNYSDTEGSHSLAPLFRYELSRSAGQGFSVSSLWQWDLAGLSVSNFTIAFIASGPSLSFDSLTLDTASQFNNTFPEQPFSLQSVPANLARWMYQFNGNPANRATASVFGSLGSTPQFDSRDAQYLLGWNTTNHVPAGKGARNYLIRRARVTLTLASGNQYTYTGTLRDYRAYFPTNDPRYVPAPTTSSPVELFGAGYRGGYTVATFPQDGPWGVNPAGYYTNRTVYAAGFDTNGSLVDVSNNVGDDGANEIVAPFEIAPFAVGQTTNVAPGELMPAESQLTFDLNLDDPLIYSYVQQGLDEGQLNLVASSLVSASFAGPPTYPTFYTIFSPIAAPNQFPSLVIEGAILRPNVDDDGDGLPDDWENFYFGSLVNSATDDLDGDGADNSAEFQTGTIPTSGSSVLRLLSIQPDTNAVGVQFTHVPGHRYSIDWSDDLRTWQSLTNPVLYYSSAWLAKSAINPAYPSPVFAEWRDTNAANPRCFYRIAAHE